MILNEPNYWDQRYCKGGISGEGSIGDYRDWKWHIIKKYTDKLENLNSVIDIGCGDLSFWEGKTCKKYIGMDVSKTIIEKNIVKKPEWTFFCNSADIRKDIKSNCVFCFDILFHIMDDNTYEKILKNVISYSQNMIFIYTWIRNPLNDTVVKRAIRHKRIANNHRNFSLNNSDHRKNQWTDEGTVESGYLVSTCCFFNRNGRASARHS